VKLVPYLIRERESSHLTPLIPLSLKGEGEIKKRGEAPLKNSPLKRWIKELLNLSPLRKGRPRGSYAFALSNAHFRDLPFSGDISLV